MMRIGTVEDATESPSPVPVRDGTDNVVGVGWTGTCGSRCSIDRGRDRARIGHPGDRQPESPITEAIAPALHPRMGRPPHHSVTGVTGVTAVASPIRLRGDYSHGRDNVPDRHRRLP